MKVLTIIPVDDMAGREGEYFVIEDQDVTTALTPWFYMLQKPFTERRTRNLSKEGIMILYGLSEVEGIFSVRFGSKIPDFPHLEAKTFVVGYADNADSLKVGETICNVISRLY